MVHFTFFIAFLSEPIIKVRLLDFLILSCELHTQTLPFMYVTVGLSQMETVIEGVGLNKKSEKEVNPQPYGFLKGQGSI
jgi:hypothetical protein